jgi:hypothetical protein
VTRLVYHYQNKTRDQLKTCRQNLICGPKVFWFFQQITLISPALITNGHLMIIQECTNVLDRRTMTLIEVNAECRHLKKLTCKGTLRQMLSEFIDRSSQCLAYIQSCWYFQHSFVICTLPCCLSPHFSGSTLPPPPPPWE